MSGRSKLPEGYPLAVDMSRRVGQDPRAIVALTVQRDDQKQYRLLTHNGLREILSVSPPMTPDEVTEFLHSNGLGNPQAHWNDYRDLRRPRRGKVFGPRLWDEINWWDMDPPALPSSDRSN